MSLARASGELRRKFPSGGLGFARLGEALLREGRAVEAIEFLADGTRRHPGYLAGRLVLGRAYRAAGRPAEAEAEFEDALRIDGGCPAARAALDALRSETAPVPAEVSPMRPAPAPEADEGGDFDEEDGVDATPHVATATLAEIYFQQGLKEQAQWIYRQILERQPDNEPAKKRLREIEAS